jgi:hypothetical protein
MRIEHYRRDADRWILSEVSGPDTVLHLESIDCHVAVGAIYERVDLSPS